MKLVWLLLSGLLLTVSPAGPARSEPCTAAATCRDELPLSSGKTIPYYASFPLLRNDAIERAVIVVHGNSRNGDAYYDRLVASASAENRLDDSLLLAPNFRTQDDGPAPNEHYWSSGGWKIGHKSLDDPGRFSSFAVMNELLERACSTSTFPRLRTVAIIGHSAGGQFVNRYVAGGSGCPSPGVEVRYVVMNPSSYLYVDGLRRSSSGDFERPTSCPPYNEYKYGLDDLNTYMSLVGKTQIRANLFARPTYYLAGEEDTSTSGSLDTSCSGNAQGPNRRERHENYRRYGDLFAQWTGSEFLTIPGIGHSGRQMLLSEKARSIMFRSDPGQEAGAPLPPVLLPAAAP